MDAGGYTYVRVKGDTGEVWAAAPQFPVKVGDRVRVQLEMPMVNFHSASLNRDFPLLYFVTQIVPATAAAASPGAPPADAVHGAPRSPAPVVATPMPAPPGGMTIAQVWADRKTLAGKPVTVRGVVVKFNPGILGVNWIHLQDGTGQAADGSNDITVTSTDAVALSPGDTVVATGTAVLDRDIGSGYAYPILIDKALLTVFRKAAS
jgi:hypothetical protein